MADMILLPVLELQIGVSQAKRVVLYVRLLP